MPDSQNMTDYDVARRQEVTRRLRSAYKQCDSFPEDLPDGWARLIHLRSVIPDALTELERDLPRESAEAAGQRRFKFG